MNNPRKSSFSALTQYLVDDQGKQERVGDVIINNCQSMDAKWAAIEVEATQSLNTRAKSDKTYHLLVSFREGEDLTTEQLKDIEKQLAEALGFGEHQRIAVVHRDTDNLHMHMAINKIHPVSHTLHEPYQDFKIRDEMCIAIEKQYNLQPDNHRQRKTRSQAKASDMENMSGIESLMSYVKNLVPDIEQAHSWHDLHSLLDQHGLHIKKKGNGLVITDDNDIAVKCSSVDRNLSKAALEKKLGEFESNRLSEKERSGVLYQPRPIDQNSVSSDLWEQYQRELHTFSQIKNVKISSLSKAHRAEIASLKANANLKRKVLKMADRGVLKRIALKHISKQLKRDIDGANKKYAKARLSVYANHRRTQWQQWLKAQATAGNHEALKVLRRRNKQTKKSGDHFSDKHNTVVSPTPLKNVHTSHVTSNGNMVFNIANTEIKDTGDVIKLGKHSTLNGIEAALRIAMDKYGNNLNVTGSNSFKTNVARLVVNKGIDVSFSDKNITHLINRLSINPNSGAIYHERQTPRVGKRVSGVGQRRTDDYANARRSRIAAAAGRAAKSISKANRTSAQNYAAARQSRIAAAARNAAESISATLPARTRTDPRRDYDNRRLQQSNFGKLGAFPPPQSQNNLRGMSELSVVRIAKRSEMLLPSNVSHNVVEQRPERDQRLRRNLSGTRTRVNEQVENTLKSKAVDKYINERNTKRRVFDDISKHMAFSSSDSGRLNFAGLRKFDNGQLALFKSNETILVLEINNATANRLRRVKLGHDVNVSEQGIVTIMKKGITR